ncbi:glutathione S-transferase family protein [Bradyrhizobium sp. Ash2021]|uniref:glutathione S-transferase family protein n=1 Tax=Bradyrhizobium sp. Ash2021 TaxID=2954771 RepID=UPI002815500F|nr:glutathione S-transferase family protein [Bradyrhizobium sp. Ash2021]WMT72114.1 glutathione S-transferase family protein [Bradyrhizobium sp. Ash2021]
MSDAGDTLRSSSDQTAKSLSAATGGPLRVLGRANSFNVRKVLWVCDEIGIPFVREDFGRGFKPTNTAEFLKLNLTGQVPVVIDGTRVMRESNTIVRYLAAKHRATDLYPEDFGGRQAIEQWMDWVAYDVTHALRGAFLGGQLKEAPYDHPWYVEQGQKELIHVIGLLNGHLAAHGPYMMGNHFTIADIPMGLVVNRWFMLSGLVRPHYAAVAAYYELMTERPGFREHGRNGLP